jgi:hypothetical protein
MALFFFAVGMEIKREFLFGSLSSLRQAVLPCLGALGGMIVPMAICVAINLQVTRWEAMGGPPAHTLRQAREACSCAKTESEKSPPIAHRSWRAR